MQPKVLKRITEQHLSRWRCIPILISLFQPSLPQDTYSRYICNAEQLIQTWHLSKQILRFQDTYYTVADRNFRSSKSKQTSHNHNSTFHLCQQTLCKLVYSTVPRAYHPGFSVLAERKPTDKLTWSMFQGLHKYVKNPRVSELSFPVFQIPPKLKCILKVLLTCVHIHTTLPIMNSLKILNIQNMSSILVNAKSQQEKTSIPIKQKNNITQTYL